MIMMVVVSISRYHPGDQPSSPRRGEPSKRRSLRPHEGTAGAINSLGAKHIDKPVDDIVVDDKNKVVTTPCYMLGPGPAAVGAGIEKLVAKILGWL